MHWGSTRGWSKIWHDAGSESGLLVFGVIAPSREHLQGRLHPGKDFGPVADLLLAEIAHAVANPTADALEEELIELGLLEHCRPALQRRRDRAQGPSGGAGEETEP